MIQNWMQQIAQLRNEYDIEVIWVTSGAIATARDSRRPNRKPESIAQKQALSAIGQPRIMSLYHQALSFVGLTCGQVLLVASDLSARDRRSNFVNSLNQLLRWGVVPILNENDAVGTEEIRFGDNDSLSAKVALHAKANRLVILTDVEGLYDADPASDPDAKLRQTVPAVTPELVEGLSSANLSERGTGGIYSKVLAAKEATEAGIDTWLSRGDLPRVLVRIAEGESLGTHFQVPSK